MKYKKQEKRNLQTASKWPYRESATEDIYNADKE